MKPAPHRVVLGLLYVVALAAVVLSLREGWPYYSTPLIERPRHEDFWTLKPGGTRGHLFGVIGSSLMVVMLVYSVRKRARFLRNAGRLRSWLDFHIFCGIIGPLLVILHSSFKVQGLVALSFWSMIAVALSGVLGRYLYLQIPRTRAGDELTLAQVEDQRRELTRHLRDDLQVPEGALREIDEIAQGRVAPQAPLLLLLFRLPWSSVAMRWRLRSFRQRLRGDLRNAPRPLLREVTRAVRQKAMLERRLVLWNRLQQLFHYWHVFHKPFAIVMYLFMVVHIAVALLTGYGWRS
jgi:hypothetical protein